MQRKQTIKLSISVAFLLVTWSALSLTRYPATEFLPSIYSGVPLVVYGFLIVSFGIFALIAIYDKRFSGLAFAGAGLVPLIFVFLPYIRTGLAYDRADVLAHIGIVRDLLSSGVLNTEFVSYPILHLFTAMLLAPTRIAEGLAFTLILATLTIVFVFFVVLLTRGLFRDTKMAIIAGLVAYIPILGGYNSALVPNGVALFLVVPTLFAVHQWVLERGWRWFLLTALLLGATALAHPLVAFLLVHAFGAAALTIQVLTWYDSNVITTATNRVYSKITVGLTLAIGSWYILSTTIWEDFVLRLSSVVTAIQRSSSGTRDVGGRLSVLDTTDLLELFALQYGARAIIALLTVGGVITVARRSDRRNWFLFAPPAFWLVFNAFYLVVGLVAPAATFPPLRFVDMIYATAPLFAAAFITGRINRSDIRWHQVAAVSVITISLFSIGAVGLYQGQHTTGHNSQQTQVEMESAEWVIEHKANYMPLIGFETSRYEQSILGFEEVRTDRRNEYPRSYEPYARLPINLTTPDGVFITDALEDKRYIRITEQDYVNGIQDRLQPEHEEQLASQSHKIYDGEEYRLYYSGRGVKEEENGEQD